MLNYMKEILLKSSVLIGILIVWQIVCGVILPKTNPDFITILPPPSLVLEQAIKLIGNGILFLHILKSMERVLIAFVVATAIAIPLGIAIGWWKRCEDMVDPLMEILRPIPPLAWIPLGILWFGIGDTQNIFIIFLGIFFPILVNTIAGVKAVDKTLDLGRFHIGSQPETDFPRDCVSRFPALHFDRHSCWVGNGLDVPRRCRTRSIHTRARFHDPGRSLSAPYGKGYPGNAGNRPVGLCDG